MDVDFTHVGAGGGEPQLERTGAHRLGVGDVDEGLAADGLQVLEEVGEKPRRRGVAGADECAVRAPLGRRGPTRAEGGVAEQVPHAHVALELELAEGHPPEQSFRQSLRRRAAAAVPALQRRRVERKRVDLQALRPHLAS